MSRGPITLPTAEHIEQTRALKAMLREHVASLAGAAALPTGSVKTVVANGTTPYGNPWSDVTRYNDLVIAAVAEFKIDSAARVFGHIEIESQGNPKAVQVNPTYGDTYGLMQVNPKVWLQTINQLSGKSFSNPVDAGKALFEPALAIRVGCAVLRSYYDKFGTWDGASSGFFTNTKNWNLSDSVNGTTGKNYQRALNDLIAEVNAGGWVNPFPKPVLYDLVSDCSRYTVYGAKMSKSQAQYIRNQCFPGRNGAVPRAVFWHIQDGYVNGSLEHWLDAGIQASSSVMIQRDGSLLRVIPDTDAPWTNGDVAKPTARGQLAIAMSDGINLNDICLTIEHEGKGGQTLTPEQLNASCWMTTEWFHRYPNITLDQCFDHSDVNMVTRAGCPGAALDAQLRAALSGGAAPGPDPTPVVTDVLPGVSLDDAKKLFPDFNPAGPVSQAWLARARETGELPALAASGVSNSATYAKAWVFQNGWRVFTDKAGAVVSSDDAWT